MNSIFYEDLAPKEFLERLAECPVGYLPLGTIEWHGLHNPLGADAIEGKELFALAARKIGGIVFPELFLGPDRTCSVDGKDYCGMDMYEDYLRCPPYPLQQFPGSCYWVSDDLYKRIIDAIARQAARAGFKVIVGVGHGPSTNLFASMAEAVYEKYGIRFITPYDGDCKVSYISDHAAKSETSNIMYFHPELVHLDRLSKNPEEFPQGVSGDDPRYHASSEYAAGIIDSVLVHLEKLIKDSLSKED